MESKIYIDPETETLIFEDDAGRKANLDDLKVKVVCDPDTGELLLKLDES